jgi:hypothetical protein
MNNAKFDGGQLSASEISVSEKKSRCFYVNVTKTSTFHPAMLCAYMPINFNPDQTTLPKISDMFDQQSGVEIGIKSGIKSRIKNGNKK